MCIRDRLESTPKHPVDVKRSKLPDYYRDLIERMIREDPLERPALDEICEVFETEIEALELESERRTSKKKTSKFWQGLSALLTSLIIALLLDRNFNMEECRSHGVVECVVPECPELDGTSVDEFRELASKYFELGVYCQELELFDKANDLHQRSLDLREISGTDNRLDIADSYHELGVTYDMMDDSKKAIENLESALQIRLEEDAFVESSDSNLALAVVYRKIMFWEEAREHAERALEIRREELGPDDDDTMAAQLELVLIYDYFGMDSEALDYFREAYGLFERRVESQQIPNDELNVYSYYEERVRSEDNPFAGFRKALGKVFSHRPTRARRGSTSTRTPLI
eukprot:TRINITY_DN24039_c0_g1_i2.p1 TRINITY_DN24039_c0_g1~~TRINITY_DN24039_c0_g1_i2.p1  ORF type:complete len:363 (-),score=50.19 TRINITY_DN24039_c0_g1_i2:110-1141(-)